MRAPAKPSVTHSDGGEREPDAGELGEPAERRAEDGAEDRGAERRADHLAATLARSGDRDPRERARPGRGAGDPLDEPCAAERECAVGRGEREARHCERGEGRRRRLASARSVPRRARPGCLRAARRRRRRRRAARRRPSRGRTRRRTPGERRQRGEEQRVDEDDRADEDEETAHARRGYAGKKNAPSRLRPRPTFRLTTAEATTTRRAINLRHSVLGASGTLWDRMVTGQARVGQNSAQFAGKIRPISPIASQDR